MLVSVPEQVMHVYRNGILIGRSIVSTGSTGHATPGGAFSILEKADANLVAIHSTGTAALIDILPSRDVAGCRENRIPAGP